MRSERERKREIERYMRFDAGEREGLEEREREGEQRRVGNKRGEIERDR